MNDQQSLGGINVNITASYDKFEQGISTVESKLDGLTQKFSSAGTKISTATVALGNVIANVVSKVVSVITQNIGYATKRLDSLNRFPIVMQNLGINANEAKNAINALANYTLGLPTTLNDAAEKVQYFTSATGNVWQSIKIFQALNDAIVSGAQTAEVQSTALYQWSQAIVRGSFDIEREFNAMVVANAKAVNEVAEHLLGAGKDFNDLWNALKNGETTVYDMVDAMVYLDENGSGALESWSKRAQSSVAGIDTAITRFKTNIGKAVAVVAEEIGWKNIYTFINNVGDAIYKAGQWVAAFVRVLKEMFAWVSVLFGGSGSTSEIVKETAAAADSVGGVASSAEDAADSLGDATKQAKKLHKQLAAFDEMNVLQEPTSSSSGGSGGSGGGGAGSYNFDWDSGVFESAADKIEAIAEKIKKKLAEVFGFIDFTPLLLSIKNMWEAFQYGAEGALKIGKKFIDNFIKPLMKHAAESTLPRIFNAVADGIKQINFDKIASAAGHLFSALERIGELIGDIVATLVEWVMPIITWIENFVVPPALEIIATIVNTIGAVLGGIWDSIKEAYENWIAPALESLGKALEPILDALYNLFGGINENADAWEKFREIVKKVADVLIGPVFAALGVIIQTIAIIIEAVVGLFEKIGEIIAGIVEGVKWLVEQVGQFFQNAWNFITGIFAGIGGWFADRWNDIGNAFSNVGNFFKNAFETAKTNVHNAFQNIGNFFGNIWNGVKNIFEPVANWFGDKFNKAKEFLQNAFAPIGNWFKDRWNDIKNVFGNVWNVFSDIGKNMWEGIKNGLGNIGKKIGDIFGGAIDWVKGLFGISSPSKVFKSFGKYIDEGFVLGIESGMSDVNNAMAKLTDGFEVADIGANINAAVADPALDYESLESSNDQPIYLTVNVGDEKLVDQVVRGINELSALKNRAVIDF